MAGKRRSAYDLPFERVELTVAERRLALLWWQSGESYHPLRCPVCAATLAVAPDGPKLYCPSDWCNYATGEVPWGVYVAWRRAQTTDQADND